MIRERFPVWEAASRDSCVGADIGGPVLIDSAYDRVGGVAGVAVAGIHI